MLATPDVAIIGYDKARSKTRSHAHRTARGFFELPLVADMCIYEPCNYTALFIAVAVFALPGALSIQPMKEVRCWPLFSFISFNDKQKGRKT